jgi:hypothetical protein
MVADPDRPEAGAAVRRLLRSPAGTAAVWCGFAVAVVWATEPVWGYLVFGFTPTLDDLLALGERCLAAF